MAYAAPRSANRDLEEGMTDGKYRKIVADRGGIVEPATYASRADLFDGWYGLHEQSPKMAPDNVRCVTPNCVHTPQSDPEAF